MFDDFCFFVVVVVVVVVVVFPIFCGIKHKKLQANHFPTLNPHQKYTPPQKKKNKKSSLRFL